MVACDLGGLWLWDFVGFRCLPLDLSQRVYCEVMQERTLRPGLDVGADAKPKAVFLPKRCAQMRTA